LLGVAADVETVDNSSVHSVLSIEVWSRCIADKEGGAIRVWASIRHREQTSMRMVDPDAFVGELGSIDAQCSWLIVRLNDLASLHHESRNNSLEDSCLEEHVEA
jgi:hypothetical protein